MKKKFSTSVPHEPLVIAIRRLEKDVFDIKAGQTLALKCGLGDGDRRLTGPIQIDMKSASHRNAARWCRTMLMPGYVVICKCGLIMWDMR